MMMSNEEQENDKEEFYCFCFSILDYLLFSSSSLPFFIFFSFERTCKLKKERRKKISKLTTISFKFEFASIQNREVFFVVVFVFL